MGFSSVIRRWALREGMPIREIARRTGLSRNTIRKYLREGAVEPGFKVPKRPSNLDPYADRLSAWLLAQTRKSRKERRTVKQMHADLVKLGYAGSYARVAAFARAWREDRHRSCGANNWTRHVCAFGIPTRRSVPVRLERRPGHDLANGSSFRWPIRSSRTAGLSWCAPIHCKRMRCCSMPIGMRSACSAAYPGAVSMTT